MNETADRGSVKAAVAVRLQAELPGLENTRFSSGRWSVTKNHGRKTVIPVI